MGMEILMLIFGLIAVVAGIVSVVMVFVKHYEPTEKPVLISGGICLVSLILFVVFYLI